MKGSIVLGLSLCVLLAICFAEEEDKEKRERIHNFLKCVACAAPGSDIRTEYKVCSAQKPAKLVAALKECCMEIMPDVADEDAAWKKICEEGEVILDKIHVCVKGKLTDVSENDKKEFEQYKKCAKALNDEKCK